MTQAGRAEIERLEELAATYRSRLRVLDRQIAQFGLHAPAHIILDREQTEQDLAQTLAALERLRSRPGDERAPYMGLRTFHERATFLAVLGASGSGKSSVVRAGLLPELRGGALPGSERWRYAVLKPGDRPLDALAAELAKLEGDPTRVIHYTEALANSDRALVLLASALLDRAAGQRLVLVVDQAEELWTLAPSESAVRATFVEQQQRPFIRLLLAAAEAGRAAGRSPVLVILTMRADFLHRAAEYRDLARAIGDHDVIVSPMAPDELRRAITGPAEAVGCTFEPGLVDELAQQVQSQPGALPLLEYTLLELWKARAPDGMLTWQALRALDGVEGALAARADAILAASYTTEQQEQLRRALLRLVQPGEGAADTRRRALLDDLVPAGGSVMKVQALLQPLVDERLVVTSRDPATNAETIEMAHEALIHAWPMLRQWVDVAREDLRFQIQFQEAVQEWKESGESEDFLWSRLRLANAEAWQARAQPQLNERELRFLETSQAAEQAQRAAIEAARREREALLEARAEADRKLAEEATARAAAERHSASRLRVFLVVVSLLLFVAVGGMVFALDRQRAADQKARVARAGELAAQSQANDEQFPQRSLLLVVESLRLTDAANEPPIPAAEQSLRDELARTGGLPLRGHVGAVLAVALSPSGRWALTGSWDRTARLWDLQAADPAASARVLRGHEGEITAVAFSPDGRWALTGSSDKTARLWDLHADDPAASVRVLRGHEGEITAVAFSPDGRWALTGSSDKTARLWDLRAADPSASARVLHGHEDGITAVAFSPDGRWALTGSTDWTAQLWDTQAADPSTSARVLRGHRGPINAVAFSPDRRWALTGSGDNTARLWDLLAADPSASARVLRGHEGRVITVAVSLDGRRALTGSEDGTARLWDVQVAEPAASARVLRGHEGEVTAVAFSPDKRWALTGSADGTARLWDTQAGNQSASPRVLRRYMNEGVVAFSQDERWMLTSRYDKTVRLWDLQAADPSASARVLRGHTDWVRAVTFSADGRWALTGSADKTARLWDLRAADPSSSPRVLQDKSEVTAVAFSPDGRWALTNSSDNTARLWDLQAADPVASARVLRGHERAVNAVAFSPDGRWALTGSDDKTARVWDLQAADPSASVRVLRGHEFRVSAVAVSSDGRWALTGSDDKTARLWDLHADDPSASAHVLRGHEEGVTAVAFSPDGRWALTGSWDNTARLWDLHADDLSTNVRVLRGHEGGVKAAAFGPDGRWLLTGDNTTVRIWPARIDDLIALACRTAGRNLTWKEWQQYFPEQDYQATCANLPPHSSLIADLTQQGKIMEALAVYKDMQQRYPTFEIDAASWYTLCRYGSLWGQAVAVLDACDQAVEQFPTVGAFRDSRGLARALTGNTAGAIEDFNAFIAWAQGLDGLEQQIAERKAWVAALQAGHNPFDAATLERLRNQ